MQPTTAPPRDGITADQVVAVLQDAAGIIVDKGCELIGPDLQMIEDISADLAGGSVTHSSYATLHNTAQLAISRELAWGSALVRPYMTISDGTTAVRFNLGAYVTATPARPVGEDPPTYDVACYDILSLLDDAVGGVFAVDEGAGYLATVEAILLARGVTAYVIDQQATGEVLPAARVWVFDEQTTWLGIVNDLLAAVGYRGIWSDWDGRLRCEPYETPRTRATEWLYTVDSTTSMLAPDRTLERDFFSSPNRWVFYRSNVADGAAPVEGDGIYTYVNQSAGDTSVDGRGGRVITKVVGIDAASHAALVSAAQRTIDADMSIPTKIAAATSPNPLHWHFDILGVQDIAAGGYTTMLGTGWTLPLDGADMSHEWQILA